MKRLYDDKSRVDPLIRRWNQHSPSRTRPSQLLKLIADVDEERFINLVETGVIDRETTKKRVKELRDEAKGATVANLDDYRNPTSADYDELIDRFEALEGSAREDFIAYVMNSLAKKEVTNG